MASFTISNVQRAGVNFSAVLDTITFKNITPGGYVQPSTYGRKDNPWFVGNNWSAGSSSGTSWKSTVNAVDIDWNGATLTAGTITGTAKEINSTGELLAMINQMNVDIKTKNTALDASISDLSTKVTNITTKVTNIENGTSGITAIPTATINNALV